MKPISSFASFCLILFAIAAGASSAQEHRAGYLKISKAEYKDKLEGFWLGQSLANWTGLITEMDKIGGEGIHGQFYTRDDWGKPDLPSIWGQGIPSDLSETIDWVIRDETQIWGADDDTDIEYMYQFLLAKHQTTTLTPEQIRDGWLTHIYTDENTPFKTLEGQPENYLWVSNQTAHDLMRQGVLPPETSAPHRNEHTDMIDAQLTTEIFGLYAPTKPVVALQMAYLPIRTTARDNAAWAAEFYVVMHSLASSIDPSLTPQKQIVWLAKQARKQLPDSSYSAKMYDYVAAQYEQGIPWETTRDRVYQRYQVEQQDGYDITARDLYCNGCFASGINFAASIISLLYGEGDYKNTVKIAVLTGWDSDNPAATWGGLLGFINGKRALEEAFNQRFSSKFNIHRTRGNFPNGGIDTFASMAEVGLSIVDKVVLTELDGKIENGYWVIPLDAVKSDAIAIPSH